VLAPVPVDDVLLEVSVRAAPAEAEVARREEDVTVRGATTAAAEGAPPVAGAELGRPIDGGPVGCGDVAWGFGETGLSQDEKKSSSSAAVSDCAEALEVLAPSTDMPPGNLCGRVRSISRS
jgi:hypothetical protein